MRVAPCARDGGSSRTRFRMGTTTLRWTVVAAAIGVLTAAALLIATPLAAAQTAAVAGSRSGPPSGSSSPTLGRGDTLRLTLDGARTLALRSNPELRASRLDIDIARGELRQASVLVRNNPSTDVLAGGVGAEVGITQEIEVAGQRGARRAAGQAGVERAQAGVLDATRLTVADVDRGFYRLVANRQRELLATEVLALNGRLADVATRQLTAGDISQLDANLATVEFGRSRSRALAARRGREQAESELRRLLGVPAATPIIPAIDLRGGPHAGLGARQDSARNRVAGLGAGAAVAAPVEVEATRRAMGDTPEKSTPTSALRAEARARAVPADFLPVDSLSVDSLSVDSLTALALARRPDLLERAAAARQANALASVARREAFPNLALRGSSERLEGGGGRVLRPGIGITLPAFNRNRGEVQARRAEARQAELERAALVAGIRVDVVRAVATYETATGEVAVLERTVLTPARENRRLLEIAYRAGKVGLPVLLLIRNQVIDAELEYWDAWLAAHEAQAALAEVTGETIATVPTSASR